MGHTEAALVGRLLRAHEQHTEVTVDLKGVRGYVVSVSGTGSHAVIWDGKRELEVPVEMVKDVRAPVADDGARVPAPARRGSDGSTEGQTALDFSNEQMGFGL